MNHPPETIPNAGNRNETRAKTALAKKEEDA